jgi:hypothetical protein
MEIFSFFFFYGPPRAPRFRRSLGKVRPLRWAPDHQSEVEEIFKNSSQENLASVNLGIVVVMCPPREPKIPGFESLQGVRFLGFCTYIAVLLSYLT